MRRYKNLPSINVELQDGNLRLDKTPQGPIVLVIGTATDGPTDTQYLVTDSNVAASVFGSTSPIIQRLAEVKIGGAKNIILYRIGGVAASISGLFGPDTEITAKEANVVSNTKYKVYIGPNPDGVTTGTVLIIYEGTANKIVYSNVPGGEVDSNKFTIVGFDDTFTGQVGTPTNPVALNAVLSGLGTYATDSFVAAGGETTHNIAGATTPGTVVDSVTVNGTPLTFTAGVAGAGQYSYNVSTDVVTFGTALVAADAVDIEFHRPTTVVDAAYRAGADNTGATWKKLYELLDQAYSDLETTLATQVVVDKAILDAPNLADGSVASNRLEYLRVEETDGVKAYTWSIVKTQYQYSGMLEDATHSAAADTTTVLLDADKDANGQPIVKYSYNEVNFAHQLGTWCHTITENERFVLGVIGTSQPLSSSISNISKWIGTLPTTDAFGAITANGTGLLGNKFMVGSTSRLPGFFFTDTGTVDGNVQTDSGGAPVDLGKYFSIVAGVIVTPNSATLGSTAGLVNGAAAYASLVSTIPAGQSTTNTVIPNVAIPFILKKAKLDELTAAKYVTFTDTPLGVAVVSGSLPTAPDSDYDYISTSIIIATIVTNIRRRLQPFLGKGINQALIAAAETAVESILQNAVEDGAIVKYRFNVLPGDTVYALRVPLKIVPVFELREINIPISLAYNI